MSKQSTVICSACEEPFDRDQLDADGVCEDCADVVLEARAYDPDDDQDPMGDPYGWDRDEYEPGGLFFDREREEEPARHTIYGQTLPDGRVQASHWTNDNLDRGYPSETASWTTVYQSREAFRGINGYTRQGWGCYVEVWLDGEQQFEPAEMARRERVNDLARFMSDELTRLLGEFPGATYAEVRERMTSFQPVER